MNRPIMNVEEAAKVCKDRKKWKKILNGEVCALMLAYPEREMASSYVCINKHSDFMITTEII
jgi:hypothetical protein